MIREIFEFASNDEVACKIINDKCDKGYKIDSYNFSNNMKRCRIELVADKEVNLGV